MKSTLRPFLRWALALLALVMLASPSFATKHQANGNWIQQGNSGTFTATQVSGFSPAVNWEILDSSGNLVASDKAPNGWNVSQVPGTLNLTISVPLTAASGLNYQAIYVDPPPVFGISVTFNVGSPPPLAPTNLTASPANVSVNLSWTASASATSYTAWYSTTSGGPYTMSQSGITATNCVVGGLTNGTQYFFVVTASNAYGTSGYSNEANATPNSPPSAPTNLTAAPGNSSVTLAWTASAGAVSYSVYDSTTNGGPYTLVKSGVVATSYTVTGLTNGTTYYFVVTAVNAVGPSGNSNQASATPNVKAGPPPAPVLTATPGNASVTLTWNAPPGATSYILYRGTTGNTFPTQIPATGTTLVDQPLINFTEYYYYIVAIDSFGQSPNSNEVNATPMGIPLAPTNLSATAGNSSVALTWTGSVGASNYVVSRGTSSGNYDTTFQTSQTIYNDQSVAAGVTYYYAVQAQNSVGISPYSNEVSATPTGPPLPPTNLVAVSAVNQIDLSWTGSAGATSYSVFRSTTSGGPYQEVGPSVSATSLIDTYGLTYWDTYYYVVEASNQWGTSAYSKETSVLFVGPPIAPTVLAYPGNSQVTLTWNTVPYGINYTYGVSTTSGGPYTFTSVGTNTSAVVSNLTNGTQYYFVVYATSIGGQGPNSAQVSATPTAARVPIGILPNPPTGYLPDALALPEWMDHTIPEDGSDAPGGGPSSIFGISLPFGVVDVSSGSDIILDDPIVGQIGFGRSYRTALAAGNISSPGLPAGWTHNYDYRMYPQQPTAWGPIQVVYPNGASETITPVMGTGLGTGGGGSGPDTAARKPRADGGGGGGTPTGAFTVPTNAPYWVTGVPSTTTTGQWTSITMCHNGAEAYVFSMDAGDNVYRLHAIVNDAGSQTNLVYSSGELSTISSSSPYSNYSNTKSITLSYVGGMLTTASATGIGYVRYLYNTSGELASVSNVDDFKPLWIYSYSIVNGAPYLLNAGTEGTGATANVNIDPQTGRATSLTDANGRAHTYSYSGLTPTSTSGTSTVQVGSGFDHYSSTYDGLGRVTQSKDASGNPTNVSWLGGSLLTATPPSGPGTTITRDAVGNPTKILYPHGNYTKLVWNYPSGTYPSAFPFGQLSSSQEIGSDGSAMSPTSYQYYTATNLSQGQLAGYVSSVTYPSGQVVSYKYTGLGQVLSTSTLAADGVTPVTTQMGYSSGNQYEMFGKPYSVTDPLSKTTNISYSGDLSVTASDPLGNTSSFSLNNNRQLTGTFDSSNTGTSLTYAVPGKPMTSSTATGGAGAGMTSQLSYDAEYGPSISQDPNQGVFLAQDTEYNLTSLQNGNGQKMYSFTWDPIAMKSTSILGTAGQTQVNWSSLCDVNGNVSSMTGPGLTGAIGRTSDGLLSQLVWTNTGGYQSSYGYSYDGFGRVSGTSGSDGPGHTYVYNSAGMLTSDTCQGEYSISYTYAANGARLTMDVNANGGSCNYAYTYDKNGRVTGISANSGSAASTVTYTYDADGHVTEVATPQVNTFYSYDGGGRVTTLQNLTPAGVVDDPSTQVTGPDGSQHSVLSSFTGLSGLMSYDAFHNLQGFDYEIRNLSLGIANYLTGSVTYGFGSNEGAPASILSETWKGNSINATYGYVRDGGENLIQLRSETFNVDPTTDQLTTSAKTFTSPLQYDVQGNTTKFRGLNAVWNLNGTRITAVGWLNNIQYDNDGHRLNEYDGPYADIFSDTYAQVGPGLESPLNEYITHGPNASPLQAPGASYVYDGDQLVYEAGAFYIWGPTGPVMALESNLESFTFDPNGSLVSSVGSGNPATVFDAYGLPLWPVSPLHYNFDCPFMYKGQAGYVTDMQANDGKDWGLVNCLNRWYDPYAGRWLSRDPAGLEGGENAYEFCSGNPLTKADPSGLSDGSWWDTAFENATNFSAGMGDTLSLGLTKVIRKQVGEAMGIGDANESVNYDSGFYTTGEWTGTALDVAIGGAGGWKAGGEKLLGKEFSHWIPDRFLKLIAKKGLTKSQAKWLIEKFGKSKFNGNYVTDTQHFMHDVKRFLPGTTKKTARLHPVLQQLDRVPRVYYGATAGYVAGRVGPDYGRQ